MALARGLSSGVRREISACLMVVGAPKETNRTNNRSKRDGCEVRLIDGALGGSLQRRPLSPLRIWWWTLETEWSRETAVTWVAVAAWRQAVVSTGDGGPCDVATELF